MFDLVTRTFCKKCIFNNLDCVSFGCKHYYVYQPIINRNGAIFAVEVLSRPILNLKQTSVEEYFDSMDSDDGKKLIKHQIVNFSKNFSSLELGCKKVFLNIDRYLLIDQDIVNFITKSSATFKSYDWEVVFEITERQCKLTQNVKSAFYRMLLDDVSFAADDYSSITKTHKFINDYDYVKIDMHEIKRRVEDGFDTFIDELYLMKESGIKLIAEKIQTKNDYLLIYSMPFDYFQGFYFDD
ncbi:EAL domain-containing protein [Shewanella mangrovisoli]|uniref:EAL domain-containing protein n=1 Tax=Shewanella mangrovisoli TaxID=2864211 RepID=UPI0035BA594F